MEFILFIVFFGICTICFFVINYYVNLILFSGKETFHKTELVNIFSFVFDEFKKLFNSKNDFTFGLISFFVTGFFTFIWTLLGGLIGSPHYTNDFGNYFFLSFIMPAVLIFTFPFITELILRDLPRVSPDHFLVKFFKQDKCIFLGSGIASLSSSLAVYGLYHEILFLFVLVNLVVTYGVLVLVINEKISIPFYDKFIGKTREKEEEI